VYATQHNHCNTKSLPIFSCQPLQALLH